ncbi:uncharacterized protein ACIB01_019686 isoform 1-T1 [Guaruba guarouba]
MAAAAPRSGAGGRAGCSWPQPGVRAPAPVPPARRFGVHMPSAREQHGGGQCPGPGSGGSRRNPSTPGIRGYRGALCPGRFVTCTDVQASYRYKPDQWHYFKQFCKPGVNSPRKVCMYQEVMEYFHVVVVLWQVSFST